MVESKLPDYWKKIEAHHMSHNATQNSLRANFWVNIMSKDDKILIHDIVYSQMGLGRFTLDDSVINNINKELPNE